MSSSVEITGKPAEELSFAYLDRLAKAREVDVISASALDDQDGFVFMPAERKADLVGSKFYIVRAACNYSKTFASDFVMVWLVTERGNKLKFIDFSVKSGIAAQLLPVILESTRETPEGLVILVESGLEASNYDADPETGRPAGVTYYLSTGGESLPSGQL